MPENKTKVTDIPVQDFINSLSDEAVRDDCYLLCKMIEKVTGAPSKMWGSTIIGAGKYKYKYESGRKGEMCLLGFSPRKANISLYVLPNPELMGKLGKHKATKGCIYIKKLSDVDTKVLNTLMKDTVANFQTKYPDQ